MGLADGAPALIHANCVPSSIWGLWQTREGSPRSRTRDWPDRSRSLVLSVPQQEAGNALSPGTRRRKCAGSRKCWALVSIHHRQSRTQPR